MLTLVQEESMFRLMTGLICSGLDLDNVIWLSTMTEYPIFLLFPRVLIPRILDGLTVSVRVCG